MTNPYSAPDNDLPGQQRRVSRPWLRWLKTIAIWIVFLLALLNVWGYLFFVVGHADVIFDPSVELMHRKRVFLRTAISLIAFLGGASLLFRKKAALWWFLVFVLASALECITNEEMTGMGRMSGMLPFFIVLGFVAMLHKNGELK